MQMPFTVQSASNALHLVSRSRCGSDTIELDVSYKFLGTLGWKVKGEMAILSSCQCCNHPWSPVSLVSYAALLLLHSLEHDTVASP